MSWPKSDTKTSLLQCINQFNLLSRWGLLETHRQSWY